MLQVLYDNFMHGWLCLSFMPHARGGEFNAQELQSGEKSSFEREQGV